MQVPANLPGPLAEARDLLRNRLQSVGPAIRAYAQLDDSIPAILGWDGPRRYLVLTQNPAELRPTGGFIGSFGTVTFDRGRITERRVPGRLPARPAVGLPVRHTAAGACSLPARTQAAVAAGGCELVAGFPDERPGGRSAVRERGWQGPDRRRPRASRRTRSTSSWRSRVPSPSRLRRDHRLGRDDAQGPPEHPGRDRARHEPQGVPVRASPTGCSTTLLSLPPSRGRTWPRKGETLAAQRLLQAWFRDDGAEAGDRQARTRRRDPDGRGRLRLPGRIRTSRPVSKLNAVTDRELDLDVRLDPFGNAVDDLTVRWTNRIESERGASDPGAEDARASPDARDVLPPVRPGAEPARVCQHRVRRRRSRPRQTWPTRRAGRSSPTTSGSPRARPGSTTAGRAPTRRTSARTASSPTGSRSRSSPGFGPARFDCGSPSRPGRRSSRQARACCFRARPRQWRRPSSATSSWWSGIASVVGVGVMPRPWVLAPGASPSHAPYTPSRHPGTTPARSRRRTSARWTPDAPFPSCAAGSGCSSRASCSPAAPRSS